VDPRSDETVLVLRAEPQAATRARHAVISRAEALGAAERIRAAIAIAVTEAVSNVIVHAYRDEPAGGDLELAIRGDADTLEVEVRDSGAGLRPRDDSPGLGLGLGLMAELADVFEISGAERGGTRVRLCFELS